MKRSSPPLRHRGFTLMELIISAGLVSVVILLLVPRLDRITARMRLESAAAEVSVTLRWARQQAAMRGSKVGLKFYPSGDGPTTFALYADADGDGVRTADIRRGIDPMIVTARELRNLGADIRFGILLDDEGRPPRAPNSRRRLTRPEDPIRFNRSDIASFSRSGTATPGTVYLTDGRRALAVRVLNRTGKIAILRYDPEQETWR